MKKAAEKSETIEKTEPAVIYCGPDLPGAAKQYMVFRNGVPEPLKKHSEACPEINQLIVPVERLQVVRQNIGIMGAAENVFFNEILKYRKELKG